MDFDNYYVGKIPLARITPEQQLPIIEFANQILTTKRTDPNADISDLENEVDKLVYALYDLTDDEIAIVEGNVWIAVAEGKKCEREVVGWDL